MDFTYDKNDFTLVEDISKVTISGDTITSGDTQIISSGDDVYDGAAMYLALQVGTGDDKTTYPIYNPREKATAESNTSYYDIPIITVSGKGDYIKTTPNVTVMSGDSTVYFGYNAGVTDAQVDALLKDLSKLTVTLAYAAPVMSGDTVTTPATITMTPAFDASVASGYTFGQNVNGDSTISGGVVSFTTAGYDSFGIYSTASGGSLIAEVGVEVIEARRQDDEGDRRHEKHRPDYQLQSSPEWRCCPDRD